MFSFDFTSFRHRAINLFLKSYQVQWLNREEPGHITLIEDITVSLQMSKEQIIS